MLKEKSTKERSTPVKNPSNNTTSMSSTQPIEKINLDVITKQFMISSKKKFKKYLKDIYVDLAARNPKDKGVSKLTFASYYQVPGIILDRLFCVLNSTGSSSLQLNDFASGMLTLYTESFEKVSSFIFHFYDFDNDKRITKEDIRTVLSYITLSHSSFSNIQGYNARVNSQEELKGVIDRIFINDITYINYSQFISAIENISCDVYLIILLFLYENRPFTKETIDAYGEDSDSDHVIESKLTGKTVASPSKIKTLSPYKMLRKISTKKRKATMPDEMSYLNRRFMNDDNDDKKESVISLMSLRDTNDLDSPHKLRMRRKRFNDDEEEKKEDDEKIKNEEPVEPQRRKRENLKHLKTSKKEKEEMKKEEPIEPDKIIGGDDDVIGAYVNLGFRFKKSNSLKNKEVEKDIPNSPIKGNKYNSTNALIDSNYRNNDDKIVEAVDEDSEEDKKEFFSDHSEESGSSADDDDGDYEFNEIVVNQNSGSDSDNLGFAKNYNNNEEDSDEDSYEGLKASPSEPKRSSFSPDKKIVRYENYMYKESNGKIKKIYFKLINKDLYFYRTKDQKVHSGMHNLSGVFLKEEPMYNHNDKAYFAFSLNFSSKKRLYYCEQKGIYDEWMAKLKKVALYNDLNSLYTISSVIGEGKFGLIKLGMNKSTGRNVAIKIINKETMSHEDLELVRTEIEIMKICQHPNIIRLYDIYEDTSSINIVMEYCPGGDLYSYLESRNFVLSEKRACELIHKLCTAVFYIHSYGVAHRDLKPENILMTDKTETADLRILDFGLSKIMGPDEKCTEPFGTICYVAPEVLLEKPYTKAVDVWAIGVITYLMLCGSLPFDSNDGDEEIARKTVSNPVNMCFGIWKTISKEAKDFIRNMLEKDMNKRITIKTALEDKWFTKYFGKELVNVRKSSMNTTSEFRVYTSTLGTKDNI